MSAFSNREARLRRRATSAGLYLQKSKRRTVNAPDYGRYWLIEPAGNYVVAGGNYGLDLDDVEEELTNRDR